MYENCKYRHVSGFKDNYVCIAGAGRGRRPRQGFNLCKIQFSNFTAINKEPAAAAAAEEEVTVTNKPRSRGKSGD